MVDDKENTTQPRRRGRRLKKTVPKEDHYIESAPELQVVRCRKCQRNRPLKDYFSATDTFLDTNGYMSVCKFCINDMFESFYISEGSFEKALLKTCRIVNVKYDNTAVLATIRNIEDIQAKNKPVTNVFGNYKKNLVASMGGGFGGINIDNADLTFHAGIEYVPDDSSLQVLQEDDRIELERVWGAGLALEDYQFLEEEYAKWTRTTKCDTYGEELLVRELCHKQNEIRKKRLLGESVDNLLKSLQDIMKNSALTPALQSAASSGRSADAFGVWVKDIENKTPAEWYEEQEKYRDIEGIDEYNQKYIVRSLRNFVTGSRDFNLNSVVPEDIDDE